MPKKIRVGRSAFCFAKGDFEGKLEENPFFFKTSGCIHSVNKDDDIATKLVTG